MNLLQLADEQLLVFGQTATLGFLQALVQRFDQILERHDLVEVVAMGVVFGLLVALAGRAE